MCFSIHLKVCKTHLTCVFQHTKNCVQHTLRCITKSTNRCVKNWTKINPPLFRCIMFFILSGKKIIDKSRTWMQRVLVYNMRTRNAVCYLALPLSYTNLFRKTYIPGNCGIYVSKTIQTNSRGRHKANHSFGRDRDFIFDIVSPFFYINHSYLCFKHYPYCSVDLIWDKAVCIENPKNILNSSTLKS